MPGLKSCKKPCFWTYELTYVSSESVAGHEKKKQNTCQSGCVQRFPSKSSVWPKKSSVWPIIRLFASFLINSGCWNRTSKALEKSGRLLLLYKKENIWCNYKQTVTFTTINTSPQVQKCARWISGFTINAFDLSVLCPSACSTLKGNKCWAVIVIFQSGKYVVIIFPYHTEGLIQKYIHSHDAASIQNNKILLQFHLCICLSTMTDVQCYYSHCEWQGINNNTDSTQRTLSVCQREFTSPLGIGNNKVLSGWDPPNIPL